MKSPIRKVSKNTGMNPVARAVAKVKFAAIVQDMRINLFMLSEGDVCLSDFATMELVVQAMMIAMSSESETPDYRQKHRITVRNTGLPQAKKRIGSTPKSHGLGLQKEGKASMIHMSFKT